MESQQQQSQEEMMNNGGGKISSSSGSTSSYLCRQSSTRWTPTTEQIKLLKELYYINGVRSPTADQIQSICARLRRYGKIEGKNVFYWFQNHKARERQKKRLTPNANPILSPPQYQNDGCNNNNNNNIIRSGGLHWKQDQDFSLHNKYPSFNNPGLSCSSSSIGVVPGGGQLVGNFGYGAVTLENTFRDCSITGGGILNGGNVNQNSQWTAGNYNPYVPPTCCSNLLDKISTIDEDHEQDDHDGAPEIETLPLFPMHDDDHDHIHNYNQGFCTFKPGSDACYTGSYRWSNGNNGSTSLELSLNSYGYGCYAPNL